jgi:hypothetical protein
MVRLASIAAQFLGGAPITPVLSPIHRHRPQQDKGDHHKATDDKPIGEVARQKVHGPILPRDA